MSVLAHRARFYVHAGQIFEHLNLRLKQRGRCKSVIWTNWPLPCRADESHPIGLRDVRKSLSCDGGADKIRF
jgi:hypothetical protein